MPNRFKTRRRNAIIAGCVFCGIACAVALSGGAQAAAIFSQISATGTDFLGGGSSLQWSISNSNNTGLPLICGQEIVSASAVDSYMSRGGKYQSAQALENADLITMQTERDLAFTGAGVYDESLLYDAAGAGQPEGGCGIDGLIPATTGDTNETIPAIDPYCSAFQVETSLIGSDLQYKSIGLISSGSETYPDSLGFQFAGTGGGFGSLSTRSMSITPYYNNHLSDRITAGGKPFTLEGKFQFTSFALTFDPPTVEG